MTAAQQDDHIEPGWKATWFLASSRHLWRPSGSGSHHPSSVSTALYPRAASALMTLDFPVPAMPVSRTRFMTASLRPRTSLPASGDGGEMMRVGHLDPLDN